MAKGPPIPNEDFPFALLAVVSPFAFGLLFAVVVLIGLVVEAL